MKKMSLLLLLLFIQLVIFSQGRSGFGELPYTAEMKKDGVITGYTKVDSATLPSSKDLSLLLPPPGNQDSVYACWAFATTYAIRSFMDNTGKENGYFLKNGLPDYDKIYSPEFTYQVIKGDTADCNSLQYTFEVLRRVLERIGAVSWSDFPFTGKCNNQPSAILKQKAREKLKREYEPTKLQDILAIKKELTKGNPVIVSINTDAFFNALRNKYNPADPYSPMWNSYSGSGTGHAMVVVGYDDSVGAVKVMNSWDTSWGQRGYCWINYGILRASMNYACLPKRKPTSVLTKVTIKESSNNRTEQSDYSLVSWFGKGYYRSFEGIRIGLASLNSKEKIIVVKVSDEANRHALTFTSEVNSFQLFYFKNIKYRFEFESIGQIANKGPLVAFFKISKKIDIRDLLDGSAEATSSFRQE